MKRESLDLTQDHETTGPEISVVVPLYNEENNVRPLIERLAEVFRRLGSTWEVVFALDPGPDRTKERIRELYEEGYPVRMILFSRRIGKPLSLMAGLDHARGAACVIIDADLQDPPETIIEMVRMWRGGFKVVIARRSSRKGENFLYLKCAELFYRILERVSEVPVPVNTGDFRLLDAAAVREICRIRERHAFLRGLTAFVGFSTAIVTFDRESRHSGKTQISLSGAINIALDGIIPFSRTPLRIISVLGLLILALSGLVGTGWLIRGSVLGFSATWPSELLCVLLPASTGFLAACMGVLGEYLVRTYEETRNRPLYIVDELMDYAVKADDDITG
ncbi:MAG: glycosyltransferase family 2 protein [Pseudomonadota bacterium]